MRFIHVEGSAPQRQTQRLLLHLECTGGERFAAFSITRVRAHTRRSLTVPAAIFKNTLKDLLNDCLESKSRIANRHPATRQAF